MYGWQHDIMFVGLQGTVYLEWGCNSLQGTKLTFLARSRLAPKFSEVVANKCWHVRFIAFVTILLNRPYRSRQFIYFKASFSCQKHQGKIYNSQRILVANLATNFWILVASTIILVALATVLGAISCPVTSHLPLPSSLEGKESMCHVFD